MVNLVDDVKDDEPDHVHHDVSDDDHVHDDEPDHLHDDVPDDEQGDLPDDGHDGEEVDLSNYDAQDPEVRARFVAAKAFLWSAWFGATLLVASFTQFIWAALAKPYSTFSGLVIGLLMAILGGVIFLRSKRNFDEMQVPWRTSMGISVVVAGSGGFFWLLFLFLLLLHWLGAPILPE